MLAPGTPEEDRRELAPSRRTVPRAEIRVALRNLLTLAGPVILAELGWMAMGIVDTLMVGPLGPASIGAVGVGSSVFMALAIFGMGLLLGLDTLVSQAYGAGRLDECHRWLVHGVVLAAVVAVPITGLVLAARHALEGFGLHPDVLRLTTPYVGIVTLSLAPLLLYAAFRRYLQGVASVRAVTFALLSANLVNAASNWVLIYGHLGAPALGVQGAAWGTVVARLYMATCLFVAIHLHDRRTGRGLSRAVASLSWARMLGLIRLGLPAAAQLTLEVGVFATATALAGRLDPVALASHHIALHIAAFVFMIPLGLASGAAVVVGHAIGRGDPRGAGVAGWTALGMIAGFMSIVAVVFLTIPRPLIGAFTSSQAVLATGTRLLFIAAIFQLFDGLQVVATGVLRGVGDTRTSMIWSLAGHWLLGLPVGYTLCFVLGWGVEGLWVGLSLGLIVVGVVLVAVWTRRVLVMPRPVAIAEA